MTLPTTPTPSAGPNAALPECEHLEYEIRMLYYTGEALLKRDPKYAIEDLNALLESFAIHCRSLFNFFYRDGKKDDIVAEKFFDPQTNWASARPIETSLPHLQCAAKRTDKEIAHLTETRLAMIGTESQ